MTALELRLGSSHKKMSPAQKCWVPGAEFAYSIPENTTEMRKKCQFSRWNLQIFGQIKCWYHSQIYNDQLVVDFATERRSVQSFHKFENLPYFWIKNVTPVLKKFHPNLIFAHEHSRNKTKCENDQLIVDFATERRFLPCLIKFEKLQYFWHFCYPGP